MDAKLQAVKDAMDKDSDKGRDYDGAVKLADAYVAANPETFAGLEQFDDALPSLVDLLSTRRANGDEDGAWQVQAWLLHRFPPQNIGGTYQAEVRLPNS